MGDDSWGYKAAEKHCARKAIDEGQWELGVEGYGRQDRDVLHNRLRNNVHTGGNEGKHERWWNTK